MLQLSNFHIIKTLSKEYTIELSSAENHNALYYELSLKNLYTYISNDILQSYQVTCALTTSSEHNS